MKQLLQNLKTGVVEVAEVPCPMVRPGHLLIRTQASLISAGTERMMVEFGKGGLIAKARAQPDKVKQVLDKIKTDGLMPTMEAVFARLDEPMPLGYCNAGIVLEVGAGVEGFAVGDTVISNGPHAEIVCVPINLCAKVPSGVPVEQAAFTVLSAIALQGVRLVEPTLGECVVVTGLGLIGLIAVQLLRASGCSVLATDFDRRKLDLAERFGATTVDLSTGVDPVAAATAWTDGRGVDGVLITASSKSNDIVHQAAEMCRKRGRIVLVGVVGLELRRSDFYQKELSFQVSCSYGPGRYDPSYEEQGKDYPLPFVRWTEQRNFEAVLDMLSTDRLDFEPLIDQQTPHADAATIYDQLTENKNTLGHLLIYPRAASDSDSSTSVHFGQAETHDSAASRQAVIGVIGAGNFTKLMLMPALAKTGAVLRTVASRGGVSGTHVGRKFGFEQTTTDYRSVLSDERINTIMITTRHDSHARMVVEALEAGKHVFVEKPLALDGDQLEQVREAYEKAEGLQLMVGFNRRFSPHSVRMKELLGGRNEPLCMIATINAGHIPPDSWVHDPVVGGGRIIGEGCHWIDLMSYFADCPVTSVQAVMPSAWSGAGSAEDKMTISLSFADGSMGTLHYLANGDRSFPKERIEVFWEGRVLQLDNFRRLRGYGVKGFKTRRIDKGHQAELAALIERVASGGPALIPFDSLVNTTCASFAAVKSARSGGTIDLQTEHSAVCVDEEAERSSDPSCTVRGRR
ncbi:MAG: bi-domain-containing oxidoreductase [Phycisphaerae bacterium]